MSSDTEIGTETGTGTGTETETGGVDQCWPDASAVFSVFEEEGACGSPSISADGRFVAAASGGSIYVQDLQCGGEVVSFDLDASVLDLQISGDGSTVAVTVVDDVGDGIIAIDIESGELEDVSVDIDDKREFSNLSSISFDGRLIVFDSRHDRYVADDVNDSDDVFLRDRLTQTTERISVDSEGKASVGASRYGSISADGRYVVFTSFASLAEDPGSGQHVFLRDRSEGTTTLIHTDPKGAGLGGVNENTAISADGGLVAFASRSAFDAADTDSSLDYYAVDWKNDTIELLAVDDEGLELPGDAHFRLSVGGSRVVFENQQPRDSFIRDVDTGTTRWVAENAQGEQGDENAIQAKISSDGRWVVFSSSATNLVEGGASFSGCYVRPLE